ncbi:MAG: hypothetical protein VKK59_02945, partial [Vampirovibrionales bacterium]|nr:hypothetical protein [Vampirovibrionales bacterium]
RFVKSTLQNLPENRQLTQNLRKIITNTFNQHEPSDMRIHILTLGNFVLCSLRAGVSLISAKLSKDTPQEEYRFRQAVQTVMREFGGFVLTFIFPLKLIKSLVESRLQKGLGVQFSSQQCYSLGHAIKDTAQQLHCAIQRKALPAIKSYGFRSGTESEVVAVDATKRLTRMLTPLVQKIKAPSDIAKWNILYKYLPPLVAAIPTLLLSGIMLERFSLSRSADVVDAIADMAREHKSNSYARKLAKGKVAPLLSHVATPPNLNLPPSQPLRAFYGANLASSPMSPLASTPAYGLPLGPMSHPPLSPMMASPFLAPAAGVTGV